MFNNTTSPLALNHFQPTYGPSDHEQSAVVKIYPGDSQSSSPKTWSFGHAVLETYYGGHKEYISFWSGRCVASNWTGCNLQLRLTEITDNNLMLRQLNKLDIEKLLASHNTVVILKSTDNKWLYFYAYDKNKQLKRFDIPGDIAPSDLIFPNTVGEIKTVEAKNVSKTVLNFLASSGGYIRRKHCYQDKAHFHNEETDSKIYLSTKPKEFKLFNLNIKEINKALNEFKKDEKYDYTLLGKYIFTQCDAVKNCSSLVFYLLLIGGIEKLTDDCEWANNSIRAELKNYITQIKKGENDYGNWSKIFVAFISFLVGILSSSTPVKENLGSIAWDAGTMWALTEKLGITVGIIAAIFLNIINQKLPEAAFLIRMILIIAIMNTGTIGKHIYFTTISPNKVLQLAEIIQRGDTKTQQRYNWASLSVAIAFHKGNKQLEKLEEEDKNKLSESLKNDLSLIRKFISPLQAE